MTKSPFLPVVGPVRKPTMVGLPVLVHDATRSVESVESLRFDLLEATEHRFEARYDGLDMQNEYNLRVAIGALRLLSAKWRTK